MSLIPNERRLLASAYRDNGDIGGANAIIDGANVSSETPLALVAIRDARTEGWIEAHNLLRSRGHHAAADLLAREVE
jgi:hypothetical protein